MNWPAFGADTEGIFARDNWLWLFLAWAGLKIAHEFSHGIYCKHFGATVREAGVIFVFQKDGLFTVLDSKSPDLAAF